MAKKNNHSEIIFTALATVAVGLVGFVFGKGSVTSRVPSLVVLSETERGQVQHYGRSPTSTAGRKGLLVGEINKRVSPTLVSVVVGDQSSYPRFAVSKKTPLNELGGQDGVAKDGSDYPNLPIQQLFIAIREHESVNGTKLIGDDGMSLGEYHIGRDYWQDAIEYGDVEWDYNTYVWSASHCRQIMLWYWARYGARTLEECARMHNGSGPSGMYKKSTLEYWWKIKAIMERSSK